MPAFRFVRLFVALGPWLAAVSGLIIVAAGLWAMLQGFFGWLGVAVFVVTGLVIAFLVLVLVDLTRLIAEMLLPR